MTRALNHLQRGCPIQAPLGWVLVTNPRPGPEQTHRLRWRRFGFTHVLSVAALDCRLFRYGSRIFKDCHRKRTLARPDLFQ